MQVLSISELEEMIKEYKSLGMPVYDLKKKLKALKKRQVEPSVTASRRVKTNQDGSRTITYSTGPIDPKLDKKLSKTSQK